MRKKTRQTMYDDQQDLYMEMTDEIPVKKKKSKFPVVLLILLFLILGAIVAQNALFRPPEIVETQTVEADSPKTSSKPLASNSKRKDGVYTFMIIGMDKVAYNTDTIMVGRMDTINHSVEIVNIPRDTYVNVRTKIKKINSIYPYAVTKGENGVKNLRRGIEKLVGFPIDSYAFIDIVAAAKIVDTVGGVDFDVPVNMHYDDPGQDLHIDIDKGMQHLDGEDFVKVMRFRNTYQQGDLDRIKVQQDLLSALSDKLLSAGNIKNIDELLNIYDKYVETNLTKNNLYFYLQQFLLMDSESVHFQMMPNTPSMVDELSYVFINEEEWLKMVNDKLNPYKTNIALSDLDIISAESRGIEVVPSEDAESDLTVKDEEDASPGENDIMPSANNRDEKTEDLVLDSLNE
jgi:LCP family protein required for cell wall assembly